MGPVSDAEEHSEAAAPSGDPAAGSRRIEVAAAIVVILLVLAAVGVPVGWFVWSRWATVPELWGLDEQQARAALESAGLEMGTVTSRYSGGPGELPTGTVSGQFPDSGTRVSPRRAVDLIVVAGSAWTRMPKVEGLSLSAAAEALASSDASVVVVDPVAHAIDLSDLVPGPSSTVASATPAEGARVERGTKVVLAIDRDVGDGERRWLFSHPPAATGSGRSRCTEACHAEQSCSRCHLRLHGGAGPPEGVTAAELVRDRVLVTAETALGERGRVSVSVAEPSEGTVRARATVTLEGGRTERRAALQRMTVSVLKATVGVAGTRSVTIVWQDRTTGRTLMEVTMTSATYGRLRWAGFDPHELPTVADSYRESL